MKTLRHAEPAQEAAIDTLMQNKSSLMKLLRRRDVLSFLGVTEWQLRQLIDSGLVKPMRKRGCRAWFRVSELQKIT